jgi:hypothetical protein
LICTAPPQLGARYDSAPPPSRNPSAPALAIPPGPTGPIGGSPRLLDTSPSPRPAPAAPRNSEKVPVAAVAEPLPSAVAPPRSRGPMIALLALIAAAAGAAAVWFLVLRKPAGETTPTGGSAGSAITGSAGTGAPVGSGSGVAATPGSGGATSGSAGATLGSGAGSGSGPEVPVQVALVDPLEVAITANAPGAQIEIVATGAKGAAPFTTEIEKGKPTAVRATAPGFAPLDATLDGKDRTVSLKLTALPRILHVTSTPPGAQIFVDGGPTYKTTPYDLKLSQAQATRSKIKVTLRKSGFAKSEQTIEAAAWVEQDGKMIADLDATLVVQKAPIRTPDRDPEPDRDPDPDPGSGAGSGSAGTTGGDTGTSGGTTTVPDPFTGSGATSGSGSAPKPESGGAGAGSAKPAPGSSAPSGTGGGSSAAAPGSAEPTPDWMK